jgi:putative membrane protein insertion efficiency factor
VRLLSLPLLALLWIYRRLISPALPPACRYYPSCSQYAQEAVRLHGPLRGPWLAARRLLRCHPWAPGGLDPVPPRPGQTIPSSSIDAGQVPASATAQRTA